MSRPYLNYEASPDLRQRRDRRKRFRDSFLNLPFGMLDVMKLAKDTRVAYRTALALLRELRDEGLATHEVVKQNKYGLKLDVPMWSRIK
jgi:Fic family protein